MAVSVAPIMALVPAECTVVKRYACVTWDDPEHWRTHAEDAYAIAYVMKAAAAKTLMRRVAASYKQLSELVKERA